MAILRRRLIRPRLTGYAQTSPTATACLGFSVGRCAPSRPVGSHATGWSGPGPMVADQLVALLSAVRTPVVPEHGSLGASGDLARLADCAMALIGEGQVDCGDGARRHAADALAGAGLEPTTL